MDGFEESDFNDLAIMSLSDDDSDSNSSISGNEISDYKKVLDGIISLYIRHKWTLRALEDSAKFINSLPGVKIKLPTTKYLLMKEFLSHSNLSSNQYFHCDTCKIVRKCAFSSKQKQCEKCSQKFQKNNFFVYINLKEQLAAIFEKNFDSIIEFRQLMDNDNDNITDIYNAKHLKSRLSKDENI